MSVYLTVYLTGGVILDHVPGNKSNCVEKKNNNKGHTETTLTVRVSNLNLVLPTERLSLLPTTDVGRY